ELVVSLLSAVNGKSDASFGNVIGSNNFNLLLILGVAGLIYPLVVLRNTVRYEVPMSLGAALLLFLLVNDGLFSEAAQPMLSRMDAIVLLVFFGLFMFYISRTMQNSAEITGDDKI